MPANPRHFTPSLRTFSTPLSDSDKVCFSIQNSWAGFILMIILKHKNLIYNKWCKLQITLTSGLQLSFSIKPLIIFSMKGWAHPKKMKVQPLSTHPPPPPPPPPPRVDGKSGEAPQNIYGASQQKKSCSIFLNGWSVCGSSQLVQLNPEASRQPRLIWKHIIYTLLKQIPSL